MKHLNEKILGNTVFSLYDRNSMSAPCQSLWRSSYSSPPFFFLSENITCNTHWIFVVFVLSVYQLRPSKNRLQHHFNSTQMTFYTNWTWMEELLEESVLNSFMRKKPYCMCPLWFTEVNDVNWCVDSVDSWIISLILLLRFLHIWREEKKGKWAPKMRCANCKSNCVGC